MADKSAFNTEAPERILEIGGDIYAPLRKLRDKYLLRRDYHAAQAVASLIPNRYEEALAEESV